jgi:hypothetical protein
MASSSTSSLADFSMLLSDNLLNIEQQPALDMTKVLEPYKIHFSSEYEWMNGCISTYRQLACDSTAFYAGILTLISAISGGIFYVDECNGQEKPINLYVHIIGEPGVYQCEKINVITIYRCVFS